MKNFTKYVLIIVFFIGIISCELFLGIDGKQNNGFVNFDYVRDRIKDSYGFLKYKEQKNNFNWDEVTKRLRSKVRDNMSPKDMLSVLKEALVYLKDAHVYFRFPEGNSLEYEGETYTHVRFNGDYSGLPFEIGRKRLREHYLNSTHYSKSNIMLYGTIKKGKIDKDKTIGYLHINSFVDSNNSSSSVSSLEKWALDIDKIVAHVNSTNGMIIDVRQNGGGYPGNMKWIASRFVNSKKHFMNTYMKNGPAPNDFSKPHRWTIEPNGPKQYTKPIILITDGGTGSNGEYFTLALRNYGHVTHMGQNTTGIIGYIMSFEIPNGWALNISTGESRGITKNGKEAKYEQDGIPPEIPMTNDDIINTPGYDPNGGSIDPLLDKAIKELLGKL